MKNRIRFCYLGLILLSALASCELGTKQKSSYSFVGAWKHTEEDCLFVFFADKTFLFSFIKLPSDGVVADWHFSGQWELIDPQNVRITFRRRDAPDQKPEALNKELTLENFGSMLVDSNGNHFAAVKPQ